MVTALPKLANHIFYYILIFFLRYITLTFPFNLLWPINIKFLSNLYAAESERRRQIDTMNSIESKNNILNYNTI